ncbi:MAG: hypothetical protein ACI97A_001892 [Planctomycetota bacterium]|jgi:hypothetical protein
MKKLNEFRRAAFMELLAKLWILMMDLFGGTRENIGGDGRNHAEPDCPFMTPLKLLAASEKSRKSAKISRAREARAKPEGVAKTLRRSLSNRETPKIVRVVLSER